MNTILIETDNDNQYKIVSAFLKDHNIKSKELSEEDVEDAFLLRLMEEVDLNDIVSKEEIMRFKRMKGSTNAYRIRIGNYRLGFYYIEGAVILTRFLHRKDIYKYFP
jgi:mRNA interferase RelE/StbE